MERQTKIKVEATVNASVEKVWKVWNTPTDIMQWNAADPSWHCPESQNDLRVHGTFKNRMEARDGSFGFDFEGIYDTVELHKEIGYTMPDGRKVQTLFADQNGKTVVTTIFDAESVNETEFQKQGWQAILNNFAEHVESSHK